MHKLMALAASAALVASLGGCNSANTAATISQVQQTAVKVCSFLPTVETVAAILTANASLPAVQIAQAICAAVVTPGGMHNERMEAPADAHVMVGNERIVVKGEFVK